MVILSVNMLNSKLFGRLPIVLLDVIFGYCFSSFRKSVYRDHLIKTGDNGNHNYLEMPIFPILHSKVSDIYVEVESKDQGWYAKYKHICEHCAVVLIDSLYSGLAIRSLTGPALRTLGLTV